MKPGGEAPPGQAHHASAEGEGDYVWVGRVVSDTRPTQRWPGVDDELGLHPPRE